MSAVRFSHGSVQESMRFYSQLLLPALPACIDPVAYKVIRLGREEIFDQDTFGIGKKGREGRSLDRVRDNSVRIHWQNAIHRSEPRGAAMTS